MNHARAVRCVVIRTLSCAVLLAGSAFQPAGAQMQWPSTQSAVATADLASLIEEALANNPTLKAASARLQAAQSLPSQADAPPDPEISLSYLNDGVSSFTLGESEFSALSITWTQEVPYPGKLRGASDIVSQEIARVSRELDRARLEVASTVKSSYADLYRLDRTGAILEETKGILEALAQTARSRYEVGQGIQENVLKAQTEILRVEAERLRVAQDRRAAEARLNAAVGRSADRPVGAAATLPEGTLPPNSDALADLAVEASPEIASLAAAVRRQEAGVHLARLALKPDFLWSATYQNRGGLDPMVAAMFGVRLPLYRARKQAQALVQADSELRAARHDLSDSQLQTRAAVAELLARVERASELALLYEQGVVPQARGALESAQASYGVGRIALLDVLNDLTVFLEARIELAKQESDRVQALAALEPLVATELVPASSAVQGDSGGGQDGIPH